MASALLGSPSDVPNWSWRFQATDSGLQRLCWNGWTLTYMLVVGPEPGGEFYCTRGNEPCEMTLNGTYLSMFHSTLGLFQDANCSDVPVGSPLVNSTELETERLSMGLDPYYTNASSANKTVSLPSGPFQFSSTNRADYPFVFDILNPPYGDKLYGKYQVCLNALSLWVPAGVLTVYGFADQEFRHPWSCSAGESCALPLPYGAQDPLAPPMNLTLWNTETIQLNATHTFSHPALRYHSFPVINNIAHVRDIYRGNEFVAIICGTEDCYPIGYSLDVSGPVGLVHLDCVLGLPCTALTPEEEGTLTGKGLDFNRDKLGLISTLDWSKCGDEVYPPYILTFGELFKDPPAAGYGGFYTICYCLANEFDCRDPRNFTASIGTLRMRGPNQITNAHCVLGDACSIQVGPGTGLSHSNTVLLRLTDNCTDPVHLLSQMSPTNLNPQDPELQSYGLLSRQRAYAANLFETFEVGVPNHQITYSPRNIPPPMSPILKERAQLQRMEAEFESLYRQDLGGYVADRTHDYDSSQKLETSFANADALDFKVNLCWAEGAIRPRDYGFWAGTLEFVGPSLNAVYHCAAGYECVIGQLEGRWPTTGHQGSGNSTTTNSSNANMMATTADPADDSSKYLLFSLSS